MGWGDVWLLAGIGAWLGWQSLLPVVMLSSIQGAVVGIVLLKAGKTGAYCWVAMEYVEGESMTQVIKRVGVAGMLDWKYGFRVAVHIARALDYAHWQSIIHRNVTPQNIMWRTADKTALLGDVMLAKALEGTLCQQITKPGELVYDPKRPLPKFGGLFKDGFNAGLMDGSVLFFSNKIDEPTLRGFITSNGQEMVDVGALSERGLIRFPLAKSHD